MPELPRRPEQFGQYLEQGTERSVFADTVRDYLVIKEAHEGKEVPPEILKAKFYIMKIANLLFPESIPRIVGVSVDSTGVSQELVEKIDTSIDPQHLALHRPMPREERRAIRESVQNDPRVSELLVQCEKAGLSLDANAQNFVVDPTTDTVKYIDEIYRVDTDRLRTYIGSIPHEQMRKKALDLLERAEELFEEFEEKNKETPSTTI